MELQPIKSIRMVEAVVGILEDQILDGKIRDGERLPSEEQLARQLGVGRRPVREALKILEVKGLIEIQMGVGATVRRNDLDSYLGTLTRNIGSYLRINRADRKHVMQLRWIIEGAAFEYLLLTGNVEKIDLLDGLVAKQREAFLARNFRLYQDWHFKFHHEIVSVMNNPIIDMIYRQMLALVRASMEEAGSHPVITERAIKDHQHMIDVVRKGPSAAAELKAILDEHLSNFISDLDSVDTGAEPTPRSQS